MTGVQTCALPIYGVLWFQAGGGIVAKSNDEYELQEVNNKLGALKKAIEMAEKM